MIELPEAITIARQMNQEVQGKRIAEGERGAPVHKFAFCNRPPAEYVEILRGKRVGAARDHGGLILVDLEPGYVLTLGGGGERIILHPAGAKVPGKYQLLLRFADETSLSVTVQGWGSLQLLDQEALDSHLSRWLGAGCVSPLSREFTLGYFREMLGRLGPDDPTSAKLFLTSKPGVRGIGNGCLQDLLWHAKIHPRRRIAELTPGEQRALHAAIRTTLTSMTDQGGRDSELDLFGRPGRYQRILHSKSVGQPCPGCATPIERQAYLGGSVYFCPACQV